MCGHLRSDKQKCWSEIVDTPQDILIYIFFILLPYNINVNLVPFYQHTVTLITAWIQLILKHKTQMASKT